MVLSLTTTSYAKNDISNDKIIEAKLLKMGYKKYQIDYLNDGVRQELAKEADKGAKLIRFEHKRLVEKKPTVEQNTESDVGIQLTTIPSSDLYLNLSFLDLGIQPDGSYETKVYGDFEWLNNPYWKLVDHIGIAWGDGWAMKSQGLVYQYYGEYSNKLYTVQDFNHYEPSNSAGVEFYNLDLKELTPDGSEHTKNHSGWAVVTLGNSVPVSPDVTQVDLEYYHQSKAVTITGPVLNILPEPNIELKIEFVDDFQYRVDTDTFTYPK